MTLSLQIKDYDTFAPLSNKYKTLKNNTLHEYLEKYDNTALVDYKVHLILLEKEKEKQKSNMQENALNKKGFER